VNRDEHEEKERNSHTNCPNRWDDDHQKDKFWEDNPLELKNESANRHGDRREYARDLTKIIAELKRRCMYLEMERKDHKKIHNGGQALNGYRLTLHQTGSKLPSTQEV